LIALYEDQKEFDMGGGGFLGLGPTPKAPEAPDYTAAAQATAQGNLQAAQAALAANRVNQTTPYGSLQYSQNGTDSQGNPVWNATTALSPTGQSLLNSQNNTSLGLSNLLNTQMGNVNNSINNGFVAPQFNLSNVTPINAVAGAPTDLRSSASSPIGLVTGVDVPQYQMVNGQPQLQTQLGGTGMAGWDKASGLIMSRLAPTIAHQNEQSDAQLANQGIVPGTEAYANAKRVLAQGQNDLLNQAQLAGQNVQQNLFGQNLAAGQFGNTALNQMFGNQVTGVTTNNAALGQGFNNQFSNAQLNNAAQQQSFMQDYQNAVLNNAANQQAFGQSLGANNQTFNQDLASQQQQYNQALNNYQLPLNMMNALRTGSAVTNPTFINPAQQATTAGADVLGATMGNYNNQLANFNAQQAAQSNFNSGLFGLGAAGLLAL
jgi:hypothetical protein